MITALLFLLLGIVLTAIIIAANGYFVAQEFAYMSVDRAKLRAQADAGDAASRRALKVTQRTSFMLSGAQLGITVTGLLVGYVAEPFIGESLGTLLGGAGIPAAVGITIGTVGALVLAAVVQMIFGELYPKNLALANPEPLSRALAPTTLGYLTVFGWLIWVFDKSAEGLLRLVRVEPVHDVDTSATAKDLEHIIEDSRDSGDLPADLSLMLDRILDFPEQDVEHAMIPRVQVDVVHVTDPISHVRALMAEAHTRYPVIGERDEPVGVVHLVDVLGTDRDDPRPVTAIMREPLVLATLMPLPDALGQLTATKNELACVIDEYGGFAGVLTLEDLAEELVGEISDEHDAEDGAGAVQTADDTWEMDGDLHIDEVERVIGADLERGDFETLSGLAIAAAGRLPEPGDTVRVELPLQGADVIEDDHTSRALLIEVIELDRHVPHVLRVQLVTERDADREASEALRDAAHDTEEAQR